MSVEFYLSFYFLSLSSLRALELNEIRCVKALCETKLPQEHNVLLERLHWQWEEESLYNCAITYFIFMKCFFVRT